MKIWNIIFGEKKTHGLKWEDLTKEEVPKDEEQYKEERKKKRKKKREKQNQKIPRNPKIKKKKRDRRFNRISQTGPPPSESLRITTERGFRERNSKRESERNRKKEEYIGFDSHALTPSYQQNLLKKKKTLFLYYNNVDPPVGELLKVCSGNFAPLDVEEKRKK